MAAATIPEQVIGLPLFVPSGNNFFSLAAGAMPNGDDCLNILGATSNDALAIQRCSTTGTLGMIFGNALTTGDDYAMTFWIRVTDPGTPTGKLFTCKDYQGAYVTGSVGGGGSSLDRWWVAISESSGLCVLTFNRRQSRDAIHTRVLGTFTYGMWHMVTLNVAYGGAVNVLTLDAYVDVLPGTTGNVTATGAFSVPMVGNPHFAIGGFASGFDGVNANVQLGKVAFFDHVLTLAQRTTLYDLMMPVSQSGLEGWYDASDLTTLTLSGSEVTQWADKSGYLRHLLREATYTGPDSGVRTRNGRNVLDFATPDHFDNLVGSASSYSLFVVFAQDTTAPASPDGTSRLVYWGNAGAEHGLRISGTAAQLIATAGGGTSVTASAHTLGAWRLATAENGGAGVGTLSLRQNSAAIGTADVLGAPLNGGGRVGSGPIAQRPFDGAIAEIRIFRPRLTSAHRAGVEADLTTKWAL